MPIAIIAIAALLLGGGGVAAVSQNSLPGDALFPVKLATEDFRVAATLNGDLKKDLRLDLIENRILEVNDLVRISNENNQFADRRVRGLANAADNLRKHLAAIEIKANQLKTDGRAVEAIETNNDLIASIEVINQILDRERALARIPVLRSRIDDIVGANEDIKVKLRNENRRVTENEGDLIQNDSNAFRAAEDKIETADNIINKVERKLADAAGRLRGETAAEANQAIRDARDLLEDARNSARENNFSDVVEKINRALNMSSLAGALMSIDNELRQINDNPNRIARKIRERDQRGRPDLKVEARIAAAGADARVETRFITTSTDRDAIAQEILNRLRLNRDEVAALIDIENDPNEILQTRSEARADIKNGDVKVRVKIRFPLASVNTDDIINGIADKLNSLTLANITAALEFKDGNNLSSGRGSGNDDRDIDIDRDDDNRAAANPTRSPDEREFEFEKELELGDDRLFGQSTVSPSPTGIDIRGNADENELRGRENEPGEDIRGNADENELRGRDNEPGEDIRGNADENETRGRDNEQGEDASGSESGSNSGRR